MRKTGIVIGVAVWVAVLVGGSLFLSAGRMDLPFFWADLAIWVGGTATLGLIMDLDLMRERSRVGEGAKGRLFQVLGLPVVASPFVIAGLDVGRYHWSDGVPTWAQVIGLIVVALGFGLVGWSIWVNRFFAKAVRIQEDREQVVITEGPYQHVRHPGYAGFILIFLANGVALGSWLSGLTALPLTLFFIWRTAVEDRLLREELEGYAEYAERAPYRLVPGVW